MQIEVDYKSNLDPWKCAAYSWKNVSSQIKGQVSYSKIEMGNSIFSPLDLYFSVTFVSIVLSIQIRLVQNDSFTSHCGTVKKEFLGRKFILLGKHMKNFNQNNKYIYIKCRILKYSIF